MAFRVGRRLGPYTRAPRGTPEGYTSRVDADGIIQWVAITDLGAGMVPTFIAAGETFTVPTNRQALYAMPIDNEGILIVDGFLINVD